MRHLLPKISVGLLSLAMMGQNCCPGQDNDGDGYECSIDCDDYNADVFPGAPQICDGKNNDCDDPSWDALPDSELDQDQDRYMPCEGDCDDFNWRVYPGAEEACDMLDNNCNGEIDEPTDADGDGHYTVGSCVPPADDCDDNNAAIYPGATEVCDSLDNNCDGEINEGLSFDSDGDGHYTLDSCQTPADDCNDDNADVYPGSVEVCDGADNDCDENTREICLWGSAFWGWSSWGN